MRDSPSLQLPCPAALRTGLSNWNSSHALLSATDLQWEQHNSETLYYYSGGCHGDEPFQGGPRRGRTEHCGGRVSLLPVPTCKKRHICVAGFLHFLHSPLVSLCPNCSWLPAQKRTAPRPADLREHEAKHRKILAPDKDNIFREMLGLGIYKCIRIHSLWMSRVHGRRFFYERNSVGTR